MLLNVSLWVLLVRVEKAETQPPSEDLVSPPLRVQTILIGTDEYWLNEFSDLLKRWVDFWQSMRKF